MVGRVFINVKLRITCGFCLFRSVGRGIFMLICWIFLRFREGIGNLGTVLSVFDKVYFEGKMPNVDL